MAEGKVLTEAALAVMQPNAMVYRGGVDDFDTCLTPGIYVASPERGTINYPKGVYKYGVLEVSAAGTFVKQKYTAHRTQAPQSNKPVIVERMLHQKTPGPWVMVVCEVLS